MKEWIRKHWWKLVLVAGFFIIGIPLLINWLYKQPAGIDFFRMGWNVDAVLTYYGSIIAAVATVLGVFLSVKYAQENYREDERNRQLPFMALSFLRRESKFHLFDMTNTDVGDSEDEDEYYYEFKLRKIYIIITKSEIIYKKRLSKDQNELLLKNGCKTVKDGNKVSLVQRDLVSMPMELENVGNGPAIDVRISLYNDKEKIRAVSLDTLKNGDTIYLHIYSEEKAENILGKYTLEVIYKDILSNAYTQKYPVTIAKNNNRVESYIAFSAEQEMRKNVGIRSHAEEISSKNNTIQNNTEQEKEER